MSDWAWLVPAGTFILGWLAKQLEPWLGDRRNRRKQLGRMLCDLLEIRHRLLIIPRAVQELAKRLPIPANAHVHLEAVLQNFLPAEAFKKYDESVALLAESDPLAAFRLRSQELAPGLLAQLRQLVLADAPSHAVWPKFEGQLIDQMEDHLDEVILEVARLYGWRTWYRTRAKLGQPVQLPDGFVDSMMAGLAEHARSRNATTG